LEIFKRLYCDKTSKITFKDLRYYFNLDNATEISVWEGYYFALEIEPFNYGYTFEYKNIEDLGDILNDILNNTNNFVKLKKLDIESRFSSEWNESLSVKEKNLGDLKEWKYVASDYPEIYLDDLEKELPKTCIELAIPRLTGLTSNFVKHVEILCSTNVVENYNQLYLIKTMDNLKVYKHYDSDRQEYIEDIKLYLDYKDGKVQEDLERVEFILENEDEENHQEYQLLKELVLLSIEKGFEIKSIG
jgi:hypothetical protein